MRPFLFVNGPMSDLIEKLRGLQQVDGEIYQLRRQQESKPLELQEAMARVASQEAKVKAAEAHLKSLQLAQKDKEGELQTREGNVKKLQGQLFQLKTNKEYSTMQHEIDTLKADSSLIEEVILKFFDEIETATKARQQEQQALASIQQEFQVEEKRVKADLAVIQERVGQLQSSRTSALEGIPKPALETYERILNSRYTNGVAMAPLIKESCGGCHRRMPPQVLNEVLIKAKLVICENCNRILYADDEKPTV